MQFLVPLHVHSFFKTVDSLAVVKCGVLSCRMSVSRRPGSASNSGSRRRSKTDCCEDLVSYEDIIIAKYLDELRKPPPHTKNRFV